MKKIVIVLGFLFSCTAGLLYAQSLTQAVTDQINNDQSDISSKQTIMNRAIIQDTSFQNEIQTLNSDIQADQTDIASYNKTILPEAVADDAQANAAQQAQVNGT